MNEKVLFLVGTRQRIRRANTKEGDPVAKFPTIFFFYSKLKKSYGEKICKKGWTMD